MNLIYRNGWTFYFPETGGQLSNNNLSLEEFVTLQTSNPSHKEIMKALEFEFTDTQMKEELEQDDRFVFNSDGSVYRKGINLSIPKLLLQEYLAADDTRFAALDNFWMLCCLNPNPESRDSLFKFIEHNGLQITNNGLVVAYRNVNIKSEGDKKLHDFVVNAHLKVTTVLKQSAKNHYVYYDSNKKLALTKNKDYADSSLGTLKDCYKNIAELSQTIYTDAYTHKFRIKIGEPVSMKREDCDSDHSKECSFGLHVGSKAFGRSEFGKEGLICLVNPSNFVAVPYQDGHKARVCEYLPIALLNDESVFDITTFEDYYTEYSLDTINKNLKKVNLKEHKLHTLNIESVGNMFEDYTERMVKSIRSKNKSIYSKNM